MSSLERESHLGATRRRAAFTLMEVVVSTAIVVMLAAATAPTLMGYVDRQRAQTTANILTSIQQGIVYGTTGGFFNLIDSSATTKQLPGLLHDLANPLSANTSGDHNSCGTTGFLYTSSTAATTAHKTHEYSASAVTAWNNNGPFVNFPINTGGGTVDVITTPLGAIEDSIERDSVGANQAAKVNGQKYIAIRIDNVRLDDANTLDQIMDGGDGQASGSIQWTGSTHFVTVRFLIPVSFSNC